MANDLVKDAHYNRAEIFYNQGNLEAAKEEIKEVLAIDSNHQDAQQLLKTINRQGNRGWRYFTWALVTITVLFLIFTVFKPNTPNRVVVNREGNGTVQKPPSNPIDYAKIGSAHLENEEYNEAIDAFKRAISIDPNDETVHNSLGIAYYSTQDYEAAIDAFKEAISIDPNDETVHNSLGIAYYSTQDYEAAIDAFKAGISLNPQLERLHANLGWTYFQVKELNEAERAAEEALKIDPNYEFARELLDAISQELIPPKLSIERISLIEPAGDGFLDAGEKAHIKFTVKNSGSTADDVRVHLKWDATIGLSYKPQATSTFYQNRSTTIENSYYSLSKCEREKRS